MFNPFKKKKSEAEKFMDESSLRIQAFLNRPVYEKLTKEIIESASDENLLQLIFDNVAEMIKDKNALDTLKKLSIGQQAHYSVWIVEGEVNNGGFYQFYQNLNGEFGPMAIEGFKTFRGYKHAELMETAHKLADSFESGIDGLPDLDKIFYSLEKEENLERLRISYIRQHMDQFIS